MLTFLRELYAYRSMLASLVRKEIRGRYKGSVLGFLWNFILPFTQIIVYVLVFTAIFKQNIEDYYAYLIAGMVPWILFSDSLTNGSSSIVDNSQLVTKTYFPREVIPIAVVLSKLVNFIISMGIVYAVLLIGGHGVVWQTVAALPVATLILLIFTIGLTLVLSALDVYLRDVTYMVNVLMMVFIWLSPIMYVRQFLDEGLLTTILDLNPLTYFMELFQDILYWGEISPLWEYGICTIVAFITAIVGVWAFRKMSEDFAEVL